MDEYIICPICGRHMKSIAVHIRRVHNITRDEFESSYPNAKLECDSVHEKRVKAGKTGWTEERREQSRIHGRSVFVEFNKTQWEDPDKGEERRKKRSDYARVTIIENQDKLTAGKQTPEYKSRRSKISSSIMKAKWQDSEYREKTLNTLFFNYGLKQYSNGVFRSSWESKMAENLDNYNLKYEYEALRINYYLDGLIKTYTPDFYLRDYNIIIEVKCDRYKDDIETIAKMESAKNNGYIYGLALYNDVFLEFDKFIKDLMNRSATTIEITTEKKDLR